MKSIPAEVLLLIVNTQQEIATANLGTSDLNQLICQRAQLLTKAAGAIVEVLEGDELVYVAASGSSSNLTGFRLKALHSLSGLSMTTQKILICEDSELDPRVNVEACRRTNVRSMIVVPLINQGQPLGILKVVSPEVEFFSVREETVLRLIAGLLSASMAQSQLVQSLQQSEEKFRHLIDASYGGVTVAIDGIISETNTAFSRMFGYGSDEMIGLPALSLVTAESTRLAQQNINANFERPYEMVALKKDGTEFTIEAVGKTTIINGKRVRVTAARDISERKKFEETLRSSEMKFRSVLHSVNDSIIAANKDGEIVAWNRAAENIFGYTEAEALGQPLTILMPERFRPMHSAGMKRAVQTGQSKIAGKNVELVGVKKTGDEFPIELSLASWQQDGEVFFTSVIRDLTEKKAAEFALKETTKTLQTLIASSPVGILLMDESFRLKMWNPACERIFGWSAEEALGKPLPFVPDEKRAESNQILRTMALTRKKIETQAERVRKDGTPISIHIAAMPLLNDKDEVYAHMAVLTDVSEQAKAAVELQAAHEQAVKANKALSAATKAKSEFLANMSHEIRTPLNGVVGMNGLLMDTSLNAEQREYAEAVRASADTLLTLINDILDFSKVEAGKLDLELIDFEIDQVVQDIERTIGFSANKKGLSLFRSRALAVPEHFRGDPTRIRQVLLNLVSNAIKFTPTGHVRIEIREKGELAGRRNILFEVTDTGIGIPEDALSRLFQAFSQADSSTTRKYGGTGLGLSISKHLVTLMGGEIGVRSEAGKGSTFWFTLPLEVGVGARAANPTVLSKTVPHQRLRILVAEDISVNQIIAVKTLERLGHSAMAVANGQEVLDSLQDTPFDLIFMDCQMPEMDGYEATRKIRSSKTLSCTDIPIVAMTANAMEGDRERCIEAGMDDYITKPIKSRDLEIVLQRVLQNKLAA
jgi:PAS domain S-box-containing protein